MRTAPHGIVGFLIRWLQFFTDRTELNYNTSHLSLVLFHFHLPEPLTNLHEPI